MLLVVTDYWFVFLQLIMINFIEKNGIGFWGWKRRISDSRSQLACVLLPEISCHFDCPPPTRTRFFGVKITSREDKKVSMNFKVSVGIGN